LREKIGVMYGSPETTPGGRALKFYASVRLDIRRIESIKDGAEVVGNRTRVKVVKNKVSPPFRQAEFDIMYGKGISREGSLLDMAVDMGIIKKSGSWFTYDGEQLGQGRENAKGFLIANPEIMVEVSEKVRVQAGIGADAATPPFVAPDAVDAVDAAATAIITLGVADVAASTKFYEALGFHKSSASEDTITFLTAGAVVVALFGREALAADADVSAEGTGFRGVTLAMNLESEALVDSTFADWVAVGAFALKAPHATEWGGYSSYVGDPDGHLWEIAHNPYMPLRPDGSPVPLA